MSPKMNPQKSNYDDVLRAYNENKTTKILSRRDNENLTQRNFPALRYIML